MSAFSQFCARCKMRHDFSDMIQVRYHHPDGQRFDTWVSGEEVLQRLRSAAAEQRLKGLSRLDWQQIREAGKGLPQAGREKAEDEVRRRLAGGVEDLLGDNLIGSSLADAVRGRPEDDDPVADERARWRGHLEDDRFRALVLDLAWIQLEGSLPDPPAGDADDWV
jgi:hypothetical protein